jgi:hypothetical protein
LQEYGESTVTSNSRNQLLVSICDIYCQVKAIQRHNKTAPKLTTQIGELVHLDMMGPFPYPTLSTPGISSVVANSIYEYTFTDDFSSRSFIYFIPLKYDFINVIRKLKIAFCMIPAGKEENDRYKLQCIRSDQAGEFFSDPVRVYCFDEGIEQQASGIYAHEQNGKGERSNRTLSGVGRSNLIHAGLPDSFWGHAMDTASYVRNRLPSSDPYFNTLSAPY